MRQPMEGSPVGGSSFLTNESQQTSLHVGLLTLNGRELLARNFNTPDLFSGSLDGQGSIERNAHRVLRGVGIYASSAYALTSAPNGERGYLLRESFELDREALDLTGYTADEVAEFSASIEPSDPRRHFLPLIIQRMS